MPAVRLFDVKKGQLAKLPAPASAFGLIIHEPQETDAPRKELAGLTSLQGLDHSGTGVTDAGLKELAGLKGVQMLNRDETSVSDRGPCPRSAREPGDGRRGPCLVHPRGSPRLRAVRGGTPRCH